MTEYMSESERFEQGVLSRDCAAIDTVFLMQQLRELHDADEQSVLQRLLNTEYPEDAA